ncbi:sugar ABC transporter permease [Bifidobacterium sp. ESL0682]|uniref:carbohydrate ABC transporter permease n=1 Tax=Bifidobacterium sp. ESL0682 TaxID=2983212 RepID=UPI0023F71554|nr:sugar ABC transporter permease [Bifidobacterium sp. ESL0682]WEV42384.1 sugar ABC transporter permease [Bifidobacterium sp. ESL0682]
MNATTAGAAPVLNTHADSVTKKATKRVKRQHRKLADATYYWMVWPFVILFAIFQTLPMLIGIFFSFTNYAGYGKWHMVGFSNYANLFQDDRALHSYIFTFLFSIVATILTNVISLAVALLLNAKIKFRNFFRGVFFIPYVLSMLIIGYVFQFFFSKSVPKIFSSIPLLRDNILTNEHWAWLPIVIVTVWQACAFAIIIYLAGLQTIPQDIYEAASLDGATGFKAFKSITLPLIMGYVTVNVVLNVKNFMQAFDQIVALTDGGPGTATESVTLQIYNGGFTGGEFAYQSADAALLFIVITIISLIQLKVLNPKED